MVNHDTPPAAPVERGEPDAVREALGHALKEVPVIQRRELADALGLPHDGYPDSRDLSNALLALRATPAREEVLNVLQAVLEQEPIPEARLARIREGVFRRLGMTLPTDATPAPSGEAALVGWIALGRHDGERISDELFVSQEVALREWPKANAVPVFRATPPSGPQGVVTEARDDGACSQCGALERHHAIHTISRPAVTDEMVERAYAVMRDQYRDKALISVLAVREALTAALTPQQTEGR